MLLFLTFSEVIKFAMALREIIIYAVLGALLVAAIISGILTIIKYVKKYKSATTKAEKEAAINDMVAELKNIVPSVEGMFSKITKAVNSATGGAASTTTTTTTASVSEKPFSAMKKAVAESKLKTYADLKGYTYDPDFWSEQIDGIVAVMNTQRDQKQAEKEAATSAK